LLLLWLLAVDRFIAALDRAAAVGKPVVVLKVGRGERTREFTTAPLYPTRSRGKG
jgi:acyl-CoA synthetase (NDP forming)